MQTFNDFTTFTKETSTLKNSVFWINYSWLGTNAVVFGTIIAGKSYVMHIFSNSNNLAVPWCQSGSLPIRIANTNTGTTASSKTISVTCCAVFNVGSTIAPRKVGVVSTGATEITLTTAEKVVAGFRLRPDRKYIGAKGSDYEIMPASGTAFGWYKIIFRPTLTGATWTNYSEATQILTSTPTYTGGQIIAEGYFSLAAAGRVAQRIATNIDNILGYSINQTPDSLIIVMRTTTGNGTVFFSGAWEEYI